MRAPTSAPAAKKKKKQQLPVASEKVKRMRAAILAVAEEQFAERGFAATRLVDVAEALHMTGAALLYYFRDKGALYDAMMENAFEGLAAELGAVLAQDAPLGERIERVVEVWIDTIVARPSLARLILRHSADANQHRGRRVYPASDAITRATFALFEQGRKSGELAPLQSHPHHAASAIIGWTVFYATALAPLVHADDFDPLSKEELAAHKREAVFTTRRLLGIRPQRKRAPSVGAKKSGRSKP